MNIHVDSAIFGLQSQGGISRLWRSLLPALRDVMPDATFDADAPADWFMSTYYRPAPFGVRSLALVYDLIVDKYPNVANRADGADIHRAVREASAVVSISQMVATDVKVRLGAQSVVAYPGVDVEFGKIAPADVTRFQQRIGKPYVLVVGRRGGYKNVQALYQAWRRWAAHEQHKLLCVGGEEPLPQDIAFANANPGVWQHATLTDAELAAAYAGATCLVYPSLMEGFGLPLVEALTCACPVVCDNAMREITSDAAIYCDVTRPRQIAEALNLALDPSLRTTLAVSGTARAKRYSWREMAETIADVLREAA